MVCGDFSGLAEYRGFLGGDGDVNRRKFLRMLGLGAAAGSTMAVGGKAASSQMTVSEVVSDAPDAESLNDIWHNVQSGSQDLDTVFVSEGVWEDYEISINTAESKWWKNQRK